MAGTKKVRRQTAATPAGPSVADKLNQGAMGAPVEDEVELPKVEEAVVDTSIETTGAESNSESAVTSDSEDVVDAPEEAVEATVDRPWLDNPDRPKDGVIIGPGEPISAKGIVQGTQVVLTERIYRAHRLPKSQRWGYMLLYPKNTRIPLAKLTSVNGDVVKDGQITLADKLSSGQTIKLPSPLAA